MLGSSSSAICRVPAEIWAEIFVFAQIMPADSWYTLGLADTLHHPRQLPWNASYVCSLWRETAVSHSRLWSYSPILLERECLSLKDPVALLELVLARSSRPRGIHFFKATGLFDNDPLPVVRALLQVLINHSTVWEWLRIRVHSSFAELLSQLHGKLPLLERLDVQIQGFEVCPRLDKTASQFPWSQLTYFSDARTLIDEVAPFEDGYYTTIVAAASNLQSLHTKCISLRIPSSRVHHNTLKEIQLPLDHGATPSGTTLHTPQDDICFTISAFIAASRNCSRLTSLSLTDTVPDRFFDMVLEALPQLTQLVLTFWEWEERTLAMTEGFFVELTAVDANSRDFYLVPSLASLSIWFNPCPEAPDVTRIVAGMPVRDMLDDRYQRSPLQSVCLAISGDSIEVSDEVVSYYRGLKRRGLAIQVNVVSLPEEAEFFITRDILGGGL
ncbi:hypothetical protein BDZ89DRAFT_1064852 [Hymenopellis radicata]|nr:hypothetical protein BDZ89DRAFT_1064852 [Hymenopellis radicata]